MKIVAQILLFFLDKIRNRLDPEQAARIDQYEKDQQRWKQRTADLTREIDAEQQRAAGLETQLATIRNEVREREQAIAEIDRKLAEIQRPPLPDTRSDDDVLRSPV